MAQLRSISQMQMIRMLLVWILPLFGKTFFFLSVLRCVDSVFPLMPQLIDERTSFCGELASSCDVRAEIAARFERHDSYRLSL